MDLLRTLHVLVPPPRIHLYGVRETNTRREIQSRTCKFRNSFFPNSVRGWNELGPELRTSVSLSVFKKNMLKIYRPPVKCIFDIHDPAGTKLLFQPRVGLSELKDHKFNHNFQDTPSNICLCVNGPETTRHFLLDCFRHSGPRRVLLESINQILRPHSLSDANGDNLVDILLYGHDNLSWNENNAIIKANIKFIHDSMRFQR